LAGNLLIGAKESEGGFNTNLVSIKNPTWSAFDRYFLGLSQKTTQELARLNRGVEQSFLNNGGKGFFSSNIFFKNSDHSDMNR
jgi:hypothetical protein